MEKLELKHYLEFFKNKTPFKITQTGIFNLDLEYPDIRYYDIGIITDICTYNQSESISGVLKLNNGISFDFDFCLKKEPEIIPILHKLSDLTKVIEHNGEKFVPRNKFYGNPLDYKIRENSYDVVQKLIEWHFDVYNLIDKNLAIDINTL